MLWIMTTNGSHCRIYDYEQQNHRLTLLKEIDHPASKLKGTDLIADTPGSYKTKSSKAPRSSCAWSSDPKRNEVDSFARELADELESGRVNHQYDQLIVMAAPQMNGLLNQHLNKHINQLMLANIKKDLANWPDHQLLEFLREHWQEIKNSTH